MALFTKKRFAFLATIAAVLFFWRKKKKSSEDQSSTQSPAP